MVDRRYRKKMLRYWAREEAKADAILDRVLESEWFDYWHTHLDWRGRGNRHPSDRADVAGALLRLLQRAASTGRKDVQCWVSLAEDTGNSALFLHSRNPQGSAWPHPFEGTRWDAEVPEWLAPLLSEGMQAGRWGEGERQVWMVRKRASGDADGTQERQA
ncbi:hypothetical protein [Stenotrophomonas sp. S41]|uniref:hypothetical protein n=1 Tax=Stenotrophomonas sp. S41 TaxID=2767464 RepID=UPI00190C927A|nr:hypothetical protein [Stenotrophomonas sp. S41]MBK0012922.1 hypothetical protein [Stenotrophomonas sp. S41]